MDDVQVQTPRPAATVILLRDSPLGPEVFLQRRVSAMEFAPNVCVYPGGGLDDQDYSSSWLTGDEKLWTGPPPSWWAQRLNCEQDLATALVCAAVRELFEECGVLLATPVDGSGIAPGDDRLAAARKALVEDKRSLADVLADAGWTLRADLLRPWAQWITPVVERRRYDTRFFVAVLPEGQHADGDTTEADLAGWLRPSQALKAWRTGKIELLPPTWVTLEQVEKLTSTSDALAAADEREIVAVMPKVRRVGDDLQVTIPGQPGYEEDVLSLRAWPHRNSRIIPGLLPSAPDGPREAHPVYERLRTVTGTASVLLVDNPSPMTLDGTNTWLLRAPGSEHTIVIDPGPEVEEHLRMVADYGPISQILLTHRHIDHSEGARRLAELTKAPVRALDPEFVLGGEGLGEGDVVESAGLELRVMLTPGHSSDSLCFVLDDAVLTGDTILGRGTTVIAHPDGRLGQYLDSLRRLAELPPGLAVLPGHGPELSDAGEAAREYLAHREERLNQVRDALLTLGPDASARQVVELVYADVDPVLWPAAEWSVLAQLQYLRES
jgi:glyoxylase-like metal-dependent hydrolase (beta-lactamase superfamily II)/8-oxo-dGTP pyrophosphatase MutT (NUDIX family)